jgi:hypothetical protein
LFTQDLYLNNLKNNKHLMLVFLFYSLATQHFKAAADAYQVHDHLSAKQHSLAGRENLRVAQEQNLKAAEEIFKFNNRKNKFWRIDLHGLHGSEAIQALQGRLNEIESNKTDIILAKKLSLEVITGKHFLFVLIL